MNKLIQRVINPKLIYDKSKYNTTPIYAIREYFKSKYSNLAYGLNTYRVLAIIRYDGYSVRFRNFGGFPIRAVWVDVEMYLDSHGNKHFKFSDEIQKLYAKGYIKFELIYDGFMTTSTLSKLMYKHDCTALDNLDDIEIIDPKF